MKKYFLPSLFIGLILFTYQFISWAAGNFHGSAQQYTAQQDTIQELLTGLNLEDGRYMIPSVSPDVPQEEAQKQWESYMGKPWMFVTYHGAHEMSMGLNMLRGFIVDWISGLFIIIWLRGLGPLSLGKSILWMLGLGQIGFLYFTYTNHIWYPTFDLMASLLDSIVPFGIIGAINAWFWNKR